MASSDNDGEVTGVLLAGGRSTRMGGREKGLLEIAGKPMLMHVIGRLGPQVGRMVINANGDPARFAGLGLPVIADMLEGYAGPLAGLHAGFAWARRETPQARFIASVPVDTPFLPCDLVARLKAALRESGARAAVAASGGERHPVAGLWDVTLMDELAAALQHGMRAMHRFAEAHNCAVAEFPLAEAGGVAIDPFFNVNSRADLEKARALLTGTPAPEKARG